MLFYVFGYATKTCYQPFLHIYFSFCGLFKCFKKFRKVCGWRQHISYKKKLYKLSVFVSKRAIFTKSVFKFFDFHFSVK